MAIPASVWNRTFFVSPFNIECMDGPEMPACFASWLPDRPAATIKVLIFSLSYSIDPIVAFCLIGAPLDKAVRRAS